MDDRAHDVGLTTRIIGVRFVAHHFTAAAFRNILESRRRICDGANSTHELSSGWWSARATGLISVCLHSCSASLMPDGREAVPDTIGVVKVHLVGCLSVKSVMGHFGVVRR